MFVELHIIQNFAPSNLNRDDTGSPKDCQFGGYRRARISSQAFKRAIRERFRRLELLPPERLAVRTKRAVSEVARLLADRGRDLGEAEAAVRSALGSIGLATDNQGYTQYLLFLGLSEIAGLADVCDQYWEVLATGERTQGKRRAKAMAPAEVRKAVEQLLDGGKAVDVALFGRMVADVPLKEVDAACQVAHAISTHEVNVEIDYFTAVDDLQPQGETGAGMVGVVEFNSACFYRYANVDTRQLVENLQGDVELASRGLEAFLRAAVTAVPSGKQNSLTAQDPPSFVLAVTRERGLWQLANAFVRPIRPSPQRDLVAASIQALDAYWGRLLKAYGGDGRLEPVVLSVAPVEPGEEIEKTLPNLHPHLVDDLDALIGRVRSLVSEGTS